MFARVLREFGFTWDELAKLSIKKFWFLNRSIDRLRSEEDLRRIQLMASVGSSEAYSSALNSLQTQMGTIAVMEDKRTVLVLDENGMDPEFDRAGLRALKGNGRAAF